MYSLSEMMIPRGRVATDLRTLSSSALAFAATPMVTETPCSPAALTTLCDTEAKYGSEISETSSTMFGAVPLATACA